MSATLPLHIAIDGPVASGKSTVSAAVAHALHILYLDTGVMYRSVALAVVQHGADPADEAACGAIAESLDLVIERATTHGVQQPHVFLIGADVTARIRGADVEAIVSIVSAHPRVRANLHERQQRIASQQSVVMAGRDIATVVLPNAQVKVYLDASLDERLRRRALEKQAQNPTTPVDLTTLRREIEQRDARDAAQMPTADELRQMTVITTDGLTQDEVVTCILEVVDASYR